MQGQGQRPWAACPGQQGQLLLRGTSRAARFSRGCRNCRSILRVTPWVLCPSSVHAAPERKKGGDDTVAKPQDGTGQLQECGASLAPSRSPPGTVRHKLEIT